MIQNERETYKEKIGCKKISKHCLTKKIFLVEKLMKNLDND